MSHYQGAAKISSFEPTDVPDFHKTIQTPEEIKQEKQRDRTVSLLELVEPSEEDIHLVAVYSVEIGHKAEAQRTLTGIVPTRILKAAESIPQPLVTKQQREDHFTFHLGQDTFKEGCYLCSLLNREKEQGQVKTEPVAILGPGPVVTYEAAGMVSVCDHSRHKSRLAKSCPDCQQDPRWEQIYGSLEAFRGRPKKSRWG